MFKAHFEILRNKINNEVSASKETVTTAGDEAHANTAGDRSHANTAGNESIACSLGIRSRSKASKGWIVIVDWQQDQNYNWQIHEIYRAKVGEYEILGTKIEPDIWYWMENGKLKSEK